MKGTKILVEHLNRAFNLTDDLVQNLSETDFTLKLNDLPSNTIGEQLWCIIGVRESYLKAIINEGWSGFSCSLNDTTSKVEILRGLQKSADERFRFLKSHKLNDTVKDACDRLAGAGFARSVTFLGAGEQDVSAMVGTSVIGPGMKRVCGTC